MRLYHQTAPENVAPILQIGFRDGGPVIRPGREMYGVFVADNHPRFRSDWVLLAIDCDLTEAELAAYAYNERAWAANHYREWCVPAARLNRCSRPVVIE